MKIVVISDTHIPDKVGRLPSELILELKQTDMVIHAGDIVQQSVLDEIKKYCSDIRVVKGNMDPPELADTLPAQLIIQAGRFKIGVMHGMGHPSGLVLQLTEVFKKEKLDIIIFGHSHTPMNEKKGDILFFNPGSPTDRVFAPYLSFGVIEVGQDTYEARIVKIG